MAMDMNANSASAIEIAEAIQRATADFKLCPNRVWSVANSLIDGKHSLHLLIPPAGKVQRESYEGHEQCTFDFCEYSRLDFTAVAQRHESPSCENKPCERLRGLFPRDVLDKAAKDGNPTAWKLDGKAMIEPLERFMAISHVWSDGTGIGAWSEGEVNDCLYAFFRGIAQQYQCEGIWWDTICIPKEKAARSKAINKIQSNYEDARITLVHDCFLRQWKWVDAETACFAIIMSPWFSRGWTALELAKSRKVKVVFKGSRGPLIKDLDEDVLAKSDGSYTPRHQIATQVITNLRSRRITEVNSLLTILGPRNTSWPRDVAIISGLLAGITIPQNPSQQDIYQKILKKIARVSHGHLFHNSATMSNGFSWCATSLLFLPLASSKTTLYIEENGGVVGTWKAVNLDSISKEVYIWKGTHPLIETRLQLALVHGDHHVLLVEPGAGQITRAILVKVKRDREKIPMSIQCEFVGPVHFHPPQKYGEEDKSWIEVEARIGDTRGMAEIEKKAWEYLKEVKEAVVKGQFDDFSRNEKKAQLLAQVGDSPASRKSDLLSAATNWEEIEVQQLLDENVDLNYHDKNKRTTLQYASWRGYDKVVQKLIQAGADKSLRDKMGQQAIHLAAERGDEKIVRLLLEGANLNVQCENDGQTVLHRAAWGGSKVVVGLLLEQSDTDIPDKEQKTALHIAAENGYTSVVEILLKKASPDEQDLLGQTALHLAAQNGYQMATALLLKKTRPNIQDSKGRTPLHLAAQNGFDAIAELLLPESDADIQDLTGQTAVHLAAQNGYEEVTALLLERARPDIQDQTGQIALHLAAQNGHEATVKLLLRKSGPDIKDSAGQTALHLAAQGGHEGPVVLLLENGADLESKNGSSQTPLQLAIGNDQVSMVKLLFDRGAKLVSKELGGSMLVSAVQRGDEVMMKLLLEHGVDIESKTVGGGGIVGGSANDGRTALSWAAGRGDEAAVRLLLEKGADLESLSRFRTTPLSWAAEEGHEAIVKLLVDRGAALECKGVRDRTPLFIAAENGHEAIAKLLLEKGAMIENGMGPPRQRRSAVFDKGHEKEGLTPLSVAAQEGHEAIVRLLLEKGARFESSHFHKRSMPLFLAAEQEHTGVVRLLLEKGAELWPKGDWSRQPINSIKAYQIVEELQLEMGIDAPTSQARERKGFKARR